MNPAYEIRLVKENLDLSIALMQAVQEERVTAKQIFRDGPEEIYVAFAVNTAGPDQIELRRRATNQARAAFSLAVIQTQRSLDRVFATPAIEEEQPDLQAARCVMYLLHIAISPNLFTPVWNCPLQYRRRFEVRPIDLLMDANELHGKGVTWDHVGGLPQFLDLLGYFANQIEDLPEIEAPLFAVAAASVDTPLDAPVNSYAEVPGEPSPQAVVAAPAEARIEALLEPPEEDAALANPPPAETIDGPVAKFIDERCDLDSEVRTTAKELYEGFQEWCRENRLEDVSQRSFGMQLTAMGLYRRRRGRGKHWWDGIRLSAPQGRFADLSLDLTNGRHKNHQPELGPSSI